MLRITPFVDGDFVVLKVEGKLLEPWLNELSDVCAISSNSAKRMTLDLANVTYVDAAGAELLQRMQLRGIGILACSNFVAALLNLEKP